jgi:hypothetical protein
VTSTERAAGAARLKSGPKYEATGPTSRTKDEGRAAASLQPSHLFLIAALVAATVAVLLADDTRPASLILLSVAVGIAGLVGLAVLRMLLPLAGVDVARWRADRRAGQRAALEREKRLVLRSIKELEFDHAMRKVSREDFEEMAGRLRQRALGLMRQLDELAFDRPDDSGPSLPAQPRTCPSCQTVSDADARFCKACGQRL